MFIPAFLLTMMTSLGEIVVGDFVFPIPGKTIVFAADWWTNTGTWDSVIGLAFAVFVAAVGVIRWVFRKIWDQQKRIIIQVEPPEPVDKDSICITGTRALSPVPFDSIPRTRELKKIREFLSENKKTVVHGMGAIGKTEICRKLYAQWDAGEIPSVKHIGWVDYDGDLRSSFRRCFPDAGSESDKPDEYHRKVLDYINSFGRELLLFVDNFNDFTSDGVKELRSLSCKVLLTSREKIDGMEDVFIDKASKAQCRELYRLHGKDNHSSDAVLDEIIELAARHTLAVELLAKTQRASGMTASELRDELKKSGLALSEVKASVDFAYRERRFIEHFAMVFDIVGFERGTGLARYSVFRFLLAVCRFRSVRKRREELRVLRLMSLLHDQPVDKTDLESWFKIQDSGTVNRLVRKGWLIETSQEECSRVKMHPIISAVVRYKKQPDLKTAEPFVATLAAKLRLNPTEVLTHARSVANCFKAETDSDELARLFHILTSIHEEQGDYAGALEWHGRVLRIDHKVWGSNHPHFHRHRDNAEVAYEKSGRKESFEDWLQKTLAGE